MAEIQEKAEEIDLYFLKDDFPKIISSMKMGADRICEIVMSLRKFSRDDRLEKTEVDIHECIDSTLLILTHRMKAKTNYPGIQVIKEYGKLPKIQGYTGQLNQVFMNILTNGIDALDEYNQNRSLPEIESNPGQIRIQTELQEGSYVIIRIKDNGLGMTEEVREKVFHPFFTTKPVGKGTGLGLSISYQIIVEKHGGKLECFSQLGQGTEFAIYLPIEE